MLLAPTLAMAFSMSADAFAASLAKGVKMPKPKPYEALRIGLIFGTVEATTPIIGWCLGLIASGFVASIDHWIAFVILGAVGGHMILESFSAPEDRSTDMGLWRLVLIAIGTSIDAMAVGVTLAFLDVNIWFSAIAIGLATCLMSSIGVMTGHYLGLKAGKYAEFMGGSTLILIGTGILLSHLGIL